MTAATLFLYNAATMSKRKRKRVKTSTVRTIPDTANPKRFLIFLTIGLALFLVFMYFVITRGSML
ncbi:MAG: hypothetical protein Kow0099_35090 [Candidatus Abyssubacteria bacterium]